MTNLIYQKIQDLIANARHILLLTDERIDGDTIGSTMGLYHVLNNLAPHNHPLTGEQRLVEVFSPKPLPETFKFIPAIDVIRRDVEVFKQTTIDLVIISDCSDGEYIKALLPSMAHKVPVVVFDHHASNPKYGTVNLVEPQAASSADVVWRFVKATNWPVSPDAAQCLLTGICTDTVLFSTPNTTTAALDASSELVQLGADLKIVVHHTLMQRSLASLQLWGLAMQRLFHDTELNATATAITLRDMQLYKGTEDDIGGISGFLHAMLDGHHEVVVVYRETADGAVKGSMRSRGRDVAKLAEDKYGGGGHKLAAGFKIPNAKLKALNGTWLVERNPTI
ncbi:MAG: DHH family phosphoesterase [Patescibacteria group bacterium]